MTNMKNIWGEPNERPHKVTGPCINRTLNASMTGAAAGTFFAACQLAWYPDPITSNARFGGKSGISDSRAVARTLARPAFWMSAAAAAFAAAECTAEAARGTSDQWNAAIGGLAAGSIVGAVSKSPGVMVSSALGMGLFMFALDLSSPSSVFESHQEGLTNRMYGVLPAKHEESDALANMKDKYPKFKNL
eukprot:CAMPEP_0197240146 /NCGR_PEP_ID=MMETSP1429-20130617/6488_1 /TAXON_ID=49237 /ORGANISM="Chaetoceros  sp., Strain UNC1202" /LENGTH=189 /DNA_ID=CAMNT_0042699725 /DNA_START=8 /DNA_END=577 /DNA_ORIENTATION=-